MKKVNVVILPNALFEMFYFIFKQIILLEWS